MIRLSGGLRLCFPRTQRQVEQRLTLRSEIGSYLKESIDYPWVVAECLGLAASRRDFTWL